MKLNYLFIFVLTFLVAVSCKKEELQTPECDGSNPTYDSEISLIINQNCTHCHGTNSSNGDFTSYAGMSTVINNGRFEQEVLIDQTMPQNGSLSQDELNTIKCWVENGYPEN